MASSSFPFITIKSEPELIQNEHAHEILPCILDGRFFIYCEAESTSTKRVAICTSCLPKEVKISGFNNSTSNFVTHLRRRHGEDMFLEYQRYMKNVKKSKQTSRMPNRRCQPEPLNPSYEHTEHNILQEQFNENIFKFFVHSMIPLQTIADPFFKKIFDGFNVTAKGLNVMNRRALKGMINDFCVDEITNIKGDLHNIKEVCTTADIWLTKNRGFLGVTAHWLDINLKRVSKTLACRRFSGAHTYDQILLLLDAVHAEFGLDSQKVLSAVIDSGSNFFKAFKEFGVDMESYENFTSSIDDESDSEEISIAPGSSHFKVNSVLHFNTLNEVDPLYCVEHFIPPPSTIELPVHLWCCAYKLSLCATTDANKVFRNNETSIAHIHNQVINKCNNLWNLASRRRSADIINSILGHTLSKPGIIRWNNLYEALKQIASIQDKSVELHVELGLANVLREKDFQYINEYLHCSKPMAEALDILQGEQDMYYGILLPCLVSLRRKLQKLTRESFIHCQKLAEKYLENVERRFAEFFDLSSVAAQNAAVAAMSYPRFKDKWIVCMNLEHHSIIKSLFKRAVVKEILKTPETFHITPSMQYEDSFFEFDTVSSETDSGDMHQVQKSKADVIISHYLADQDRDTSMLNRYPEIKSVFEKYNTPLPSSGPVQRMFPYATMMNLPKSHRLPDEMFEKRMLLRANLCRSE